MRLNQQKFLSEINVTSLVDVTLVLLIIFMITSPLMQLGIDVNLPSASAEPIEVKDVITITIVKDGSIYVDNSVVPLSALPEALTTARTSETKGILLRADKAVPYGAVVKVLDLVRRTGFQQVGLVTEVEEVMRRK